MHVCSYETDVGHIEQTTTGPVVALTDLGHIYQTKTGPLVTSTSLSRINQTTTGPVVALHHIDRAIIARPGPHLVEKPLAMSASSANLTDLAHTCLLCGLF